VEPEAAWPALALVTHESEADLRRSLPGLVAVAERLEVPLAIADNASADGTRRLLAEWARRTDRLEVIASAVNQGFAAAANRAVAATGDRDVLVLNPDVELPGAGPVDALARALAARPRAGIVAPRLVGSDGVVQPTARRLASAPAMLGSLPAVARLAPPLRFAYERYLGPSLTAEAHPVGWVIGAAMLIRRAAFDAVGGFDEGFFLYMEDADLCRRLYLAGWDVVYLPAIRLRHGYARASSVPGATVLRSPARRRHFASLARYWRKHPRALLGGER
jgi:N-acetylglucosaminyl-diphospho-decaprenol L-rhamnosyltransferase